MKKYLFVLFALLILMSFVSCNKAAKKDYVVKQGEDHVIYKISDIKDVKTEEGDELLMTVSFSYPEIENEKNSQIIEKVNGSLKVFVENTLKEFNDDFLPAAKEEYVAAKKKGSEFISFYTGVDYDIYLDKDNLLSIVFTVENFTGGAHSNKTKTSFNYDMETGEKLKITDVFNMTEEEARKMVSETFYTVVYEEKDMYFDNALEHISSEQFNPQFYITEKGIEFYCQEYEIAPLSAGFVSVGISFDDSKSMLQERFR